MREWQVMQAKRIVRAIGIVLLVGLLTACAAVGPLPSKQLVERAIALELAQTQQQLSQQLRLDADSTVKIDRIRIAKESPLLIDDLQAFQIQGTYNYTLTLPKRQISRQDNPFEVYLQRQKEAKTWRLARLQTDETGEPVWVTQRINEP